MTDYQYSRQGLTMIEVLMVVTLVAGLAATMGWAVSQGMQAQRKAEARMKLSKVGQAAQRFWLINDENEESANRWPNSTEELVPDFISTDPFSGEGTEIKYEPTASSLRLILTQYQGLDMKIVKNFEFPVDPRTIKESSAFGGGIFGLVRAGGFSGADLFDAINLMTDEYETADGRTIGWPPGWEDHPNFKPDDTGTGESSKGVEIFKGVSRGNFFVVRVAGHEKDGCPYDWQPAKEVTDEISAGMGGVKEVEYYRPGYYYDPDHEDAPGLGSWIFNQENNEWVEDGTSLQDRTEDHFPTSYEEAENNPEPVKLHEEERQMLMDNNCFHPGYLARWITLFALPQYEASEEAEAGRPLKILKKNQYLGNTVPGQRRFMLEKVME